jgi:hypothetical protein
MHGRGPLLTELRLRGRASRPPHAHYWHLLPGVPPLHILCSAASCQSRTPLHRPPTGLQEEGEGEGKYVENFCPKSVETFSKKMLTNIFRENVGENVLKKCLI